MMKNLIKRIPIAELAQIAIIALALAGVVKASIMNENSGRLEYGCNGLYKILQDSIAHPAWEGRQVYFFRPNEAEIKRPVILFCHGITAVNPDSYRSLIEHMVSRGFAVIYSPYGTTTAMIAPMVAYNAMWQGFEAAVMRYSNYTDKSRIGVVGHSYGGGACPWILRKACYEKRWGRNGALMFAMAPWYMHGLTQRQLRRVGRNCKVLIQVYEDDCINDHRMAKDMYLSIGTRKGEKAFVIVRSDRQNGTSLIADHNVPMGCCAKKGSVNAHDRYAVYRLFDALAAYAFESENSAKSIALGGNVPESNFMGMWANGSPAVTMIRESNPRMHRTQPCCVNFWYHAMNPRTRFYRKLNEPLRLALHTPVTLWNYCLLIGQRLEQ